MMQEDADEEDEPQREEETSFWTSPDRSSLADESMASSSNDILNPNSTMDAADGPGIALLKQIFPEESTEALRELHHHHVHRGVQQRQSQSQSQPSQNDKPESKLGKRLWKSLLREQRQPQSTGGGATTAAEEEVPESADTVDSLVWKPIELPMDFLRLPTTVAVRRTYHRRHDGTPATRYEFISDLHDRAVQEFILVKRSRKQYPSEANLPVFQSTPTSTNFRIPNHQLYFYTVVVHRHATIGLGLTLTPPPSQEDDATLLVHGLVAHPDNPSAAVQPAIQPGDTLFGINGTSFYFGSDDEDETNHEDRNHQTASFPPGITLTLQHAIRTIQTSPNPIVLHLCRTTAIGTTFSPAPVERNCSLLDSTVYAEDAEEDDTFFQTLPPRGGDVADDLASIATTSTITTASTTHSSSWTARSSLSSRQWQRRPATTTTTTTTTRRMVVHPLAHALARRGLIRGSADEIRITQHLQQFMDRGREWETHQCFHLDATTHDLLVLATRYPEEHDVIGQHPPSTPSLPYGNHVSWSNSHGTAHRPKTNATGASSYPGKLRQSWQSPVRHGTPNPSWNEWVLPLYNIRQALCARIVHTFQVAGDHDPQEAQNQWAYTIWVYDVETTKEWYAPIRYDQDFDELRRACLGLAPKSMGLEEWEFPKRRGANSKLRLGGWWNRGGSSSSSSSPVVQPSLSSNCDLGGDSHCHQLEHFLRKLCSLVYTCDPLEPEVAELAIHVQSFLGVEAGLLEQGGATVEEYDAGLPGENATIDSSPSRLSAGSSPVHPSLKNDTKDELYQPSREASTEKALTRIRRQELKQSLQRYTYRVFLLNVMTAIVQDFVDTTRRRGPKLEDIESLQVQASLQSRARGDLERLQAFLDQLVDLVFEGCGEDLRHIERHSYYSACHAELADEGAWERLVREAVREQVEIEVYVPLRSVVSRLLVNGWRHEDMQVQFKMKELRQRPQGAFRIPTAKQSPSHWQSVATILKKGVGMSTLPCVKLRAIVHAAREITRLYEQEHPKATNQTLLGADDFLPIFIFCVVRADMERPCALCVLLQTLCDKMNRIGEIGYFLASFEAAIAHITELDLTDKNDDDDALSFLTEPLTEVSLNDN